MVKQIHYYLGLDEISKEYSDDLLIESIKNIAKSSRRTMKKIVMESLEYDYDEGRVFVYICDDQSPFAGMTLHKINLLEESLQNKDNLKEFQREKKVLQKAFPNVKVTSNFR